MDFIEFDTWILADARVFNIWMLIRDALMAAPKTALFILIAKSIHLPALGALILATRQLVEFFPEMLLPGSLKHIVQYIVGDFCFERIVCGLRPLAILKM